MDETLSGVAFPDPYRWLETDSEEVRRWQQVQSELASAHVREWPHFDRLRRLVTRFSTDLHVTLPKYAAGRWFLTHIADGASQAQALVSDKPMGRGRVLFDPMAENPDRPPFLSWIAPSPDGRTLALGLCADGSEKNAIRLVDVATGRTLEDSPSQMLMDNYTGGVHWLPDSSGFFFSGVDESAVQFTQRIYLYQRFPQPAAVPIDIPWTTTADYRMVNISRDGRYAIALERILNPIPVAIAALGQKSLQWRPFVTSIAGTVAGHIFGDRYIAVTDVDAPRSRVVAIPLDTSRPNDPESWQELVPESAAALRSVTPVGEVLYLSEFVDTYAHVRIVDLNGRELGEVPLPARGAIDQLPLPMMNLTPQGHPNRFLFGFSSLTVSPGIYSHTPGMEKIETLQAPRVRLEDTVVEDRWAVSADGTRIPYHLVRRSAVKAGQFKPTLIFAYG